MHIQPTHNKVLIEHVQETRHVLLDADKDPDAKMIVVAIGPDVKCCKVGDQILPRPNANICTLSKELTGDRTLGLIDDSAIYALLSEASPTLN